MIREKVFIFLSVVTLIGRACGECSYTVTSPIIDSSLDTGFGLLHLTPFVFGLDSPTLYVDFDTLVNFTAGSGWNMYVIKEDGLLKDGVCSVENPQPSAPNAPKPPTPP